MFPNVADSGENVARSYIRTALDGPPPQGMMESFQSEQEWIPAKTAYSRLPAQRQHALFNSFSALEQQHIADQFKVQKELPLLDHDKEVSKVAETIKFLAENQLKDPKYGNQISGAVLWMGVSKGYNAMTFDERKMLFTKLSHPEQQIFIARQRIDTSEVSRLRQ